MEAIGLVSAGDPRHAKRKKAKVGQDVCLGCGVLSARDRNALALRAREARPDARPHHSPQSAHGH